MLQPINSTPAATIESTTGAQGPGTALNMITPMS